MNTLRILEELENGNYVVELDIDSDIWEKEMTRRELNTYLDTSLFNIYSDVPYSAYIVDVEEFDGGYDVYVNKYTFSGDGVSFSDDNYKTYKTEKGAYNYAKKQYTELKELGLILTCKQNNLFL